MKTDNKENNLVPPVEDTVVSVDHMVPFDDTTGLKQLVVNYIGERLNAEEKVTVDMAVQVFAAEFPEFLMAIAEENFIRGYQQGLDDVENLQRLEEAGIDAAAVDTMTPSLVNKGTAQKGQ